MSGLLEALRQRWEHMTERERRLVSILGVTVLVMLVLGPVTFVMLSISDIQEENAAISGVLRDIARERPRIAQREAATRAQERRYATAAPPLGSFLEERARDVQLTLREVTDQPEQIQSGFRRRTVRAQLPGVNLRPVVDLMTSIDQSVYPVALERIHIEHFQSGDRYNVQLGVLAYDKLTKNAPTKVGATAENTNDGPPVPPE